jgi:hypothetical protein
MEAELRRVIADRLPLLRRLGLATDRVHIDARTRDGVLLHISEWISEEAIERAHRAPEVLALWERFAACSDYLSLSEVAETREMFATFEAL